jgi:hypothetical protein
MSIEPLVKNLLLFLFSHRACGLYR